MSDVWVFSHAPHDAKMWWATMSGPMKSGLFRGVLLIEVEMCGITTVGT